MKMKEIRNLLASIFWGIVAAATLLAVLFEVEVLPSGLWSEQANAEFLCRCTMEVVTLASVYLALRMFHFKSVNKDLTTRKEPALKKWGTIRLLILEVPALVNTFLYYMYMQATYGYMAIIALLSLPFVYPTLGRCMDDVEEQENTSEEKEENASDGKDNQ